MHGITVTLDELLALRYAANQIHLPLPRIANSSQQGGHLSSFRGRGMDFLENRIYQPGDDIRAMNWPVTARTGKAHTKVYQQERERPIYLILDFSSSMFFGTRTAFKSVIAARAAAMIAWAALKQGDKIGALLVKHQNQILPPTHSKRNLVELFKKLVACVTPGDQDEVTMVSALHKLKHTIKSGSLIYFLSDFYCLNDVVQNELQQFAKRHEVINIFIYDPLEKNPPQHDRYLFHDINQIQSLLLDTNSPTTRDAYAQIFVNKLTDLKKLCFASGMHLVELATDQEIVNIIRQTITQKVTR
jgi:uncharacterized protein (DUF58 family)